MRRGVSVARVPGRKLSLLGRLPCFASHTPKYQSHARHPHLHPARAACKHRGHSGRGSGSQKTLLRITPRGVSQAAHDAMLEARAAAMCAKAKAYAMAQACWGLFVLWVPCFSAKSGRCGLRVADVGRRAASANLDPNSGSGGVRPGSRGRRLKPQLSFASWLDCVWARLEVEGESTRWSEAKTRPAERQTKPRTPKHKHTSPFCMLCFWPTDESGLYVS